MRVCLVVLLVLLAVPAHARQVVFQTDPPGATVYQGERALGVSGQPVEVEVPDEADDNTPLSFRFELDGYTPQSLTVPLYGLRAAVTYPPPPLPPIRLQEAPSYLWLMLSLLGGIVVVAGGLRWMGRVRAAREALRAAPVEAKTERLNTSLGPYVLVSRLGIGATVEVYQGVRLDAPGSPEVAVKVLRLGSAPDADQARVRFQRQAQILSGLSHPAIVQVLDWGQVGDALYMAEELASGGHLRIPPGGMPEDEFLLLFRPIVDAMAYAHEQGIVHRDLKPDNVLLTADGRVKVSDFGLARSAVDASQTSHRAGTPSYMAPEQLSGKAPSPASDQYALGVMAYEMLSGQLPHEGETVAELMRKRMTEAPRLPGRLGDVVARMLAQEPEQRYPSLRDVLRDLP